MNFKRKEEEGKGKRWYFKRKEDKGKGKSWNFKNKATRKNTENLHRRQKI